MRAAAAFVAFAGPPDLLTRFARRSSPLRVRKHAKGGEAAQRGARQRSEPREPRVAATCAAEGGVLVAAGGGN